MKMGKNKESLAGIVAGVSNRLRVDQLKAAANSLDGQIAQLLGKNQSSYLAQKQVAPTASPSFSRR